MSVSTSSGPRQQQAPGCAQCLKLPAALGATLHSAQWPPQTHAGAALLAAASCLLYTRMDFALPMQLNGRTHTTCILTIS